MKKSINKDWNIFLKFLGEVKHMLFRSNLRMILGSEAEKFKNIEAPDRYSQVPSKRGVLIDRGVGKIPKFNKPGVRVREKGLDDYTKTERTRRGCHRA